MRRWPDLPKDAMTFNGSSCLYDSEKSADGVQVGRTFRITNGQIQVEARWTRWLAKCLNYHM